MHRGKINDNYFIRMRGCGSDLTECGLVGGADRVHRCTVAKLMIIIKFLYGYEGVARIE